MTSQTCFSVYGTDLGFTSGTEVTDISDNFTSDPETDTPSTDTPMSDGNEEIQSEESEFSTDSTVEVQSESTVESAGADEVSKLVLNANESKTLTLTTDTEYSGIELGDGSALSVDTQGHKFNVTGDITGKGKLTLKGKNITVQNISVSDLVFDGATVDALDSSKENTHKLVAAENLTIQNSEISNAAFLGYDETVTGTHTLTFDGTGNNLLNIALVGIYKDAKANVLISGVSLITTTTNTSFCYDNKIVYKYQDNELTAKSEWPVSYRSTYSGNTANAIVIGYHTSETDGTFKSVTTEESVQLPKYAEEGYVYNGWIIGENENVVKNLPQKLSGDITLNASMTASELTVTTDLGYKPSADTNDDYENLNEEKSQSSTWGDTITLSTPSRFGYIFTGWKVTKDNDNVQDQSTYTNSYISRLKDAVQTENGSYIIHLQAQWTAQSFPFRFFIKDADTDYMKVKVGDQSYDSIQAFAGAHTNITWNSQTSQLELSDIQYGESLSSYLERIGISEVPELIDTRDAQSKKEFEGWTTPGGNLLTDGIAFELGGILDNKSESATLTGYETSIRSTPLFLTSIWKDTEHKLTIKNATGWDILLNDEVQKLDANGNAELTVEVGSSITFRCSAGNPENFSLWNFSDGFLPEETQYSSSAKYIFYTTIMPYSDVSAVYTNSSKTYIDIAQSAITFEEDVKLPSGRTADGFWYSSEMKQSEYTNSDGQIVSINAMTPAFKEDSDTGRYFYIWDSASGFRVTSQNKETQNQLTVTNAMNLYLLDCNLVATETYKKEAVGTKLYSVQLERLADGTGTNTVKELELSKNQFSACGNIVIDTKKTPLYTLSLYMEGNKNKIADITTDGFHSQNAYGGAVYMYGSNNQKKDVQLSTVFGDFSVTFKNLNITPYDEEDSSFQYLVYTAMTGRPYFTNCTVAAPKKRIYTFAREIQITGTGNFEIDELKTYYEGVKLKGNVRVHVHGDIYSERHPLTMADASSMVVDGNILTSTQDNYSSGEINTTGMLIVKGTIFDASNMSFTNGTVICNVLEAGQSLSVKANAKLITNMITANLYRYLSFNTDTSRYIPSNGASESKITVGSIEIASSNEDDYPFIIYSGNISSGKILDFSGGNVYLLGHYKTDGKYYDLSIQGTDNDNPVNKYISSSLDSVGNPKSTAEINETDLQETIAETGKDMNLSECVMWGNSTYTANTSTMRSVALSGSSIYAKGNITFFNDTTVSGGTIVCVGSFGTKADLAITGGTITADTVGNVGNLTSEFDDHTQSWKKTSITGGTVNANVIGARESYGQNNSEQRSLVEITDGTIQELANVRSDERINYIYDTTVFPDDKNKFASLSNNIRLKTEYKNGETGEWSTEEISNISSPIQSDGTPGKWIYDSLSGSEITGISANATVLPKTDGEQQVSVQGKNRLKLYAAQKQYTLIKAYGDNKYRISAGNSALNFTNTSITDIGDQSTREVSQAKVDAGADITLSLTNAENQTRTVVWYTDANGQYHNALAGKSWDNGKITFSMPNGDCFIYVVDENYALPLDLKVSGLSFTKDGFMTEFASVASDGMLTAKNEENVFTYSGAYRIVQSNINENEIQVGTNKDYPMLTIKEVTHKTKNRIIFAKDFNNTGESGQKITVSRVFQHCNDTEFGTILEGDTSGGAKVCMELDGKVAMFRFQIKEEMASLHLKGSNKDCTDILYFNKAQMNSPSTYLTNAGNNDGKTGTFILENLTLNMLNGYSGYLLFAQSGSYQSGSLKMIGCKLHKSWGDSTGIARNITDVTLDGCDLDITTNTGYATALFDGCKTVSIENNSVLKWKNIGSTNTGGFPLDYGISGILTIDNSNITTTYEPRANEGTYLVNPSSGEQASKLVLKNNATFTADSRLTFNALEVSSGALLNVKKQENGTEETWLLCKDILVDGGSVTADNIIVSGFYDHKVYGHSAAYKTSLDVLIRDKTDMIEKGSLKITSGTVNAAKFAGGDVDAKVEVTGGTLNASAIGTSGYLYGFPRQLPVNKVDYMYRYSILEYSKYTESATVTVSGNGVINVSDNGYLGGMRCTVEVQGGTVNLGNGAALGLTEEQQKKLEDYYSSKGEDVAKDGKTNCTVNASGGYIQLLGQNDSDEDGAVISADIRVPYGMVDISGEAKVKVSNILADRGSIYIRKTNGGYANPYSGNESSKYKNNNIGVWVLDTISAENLEITEGAQVYAKNAYAVVRKSGDNYQGSLTVKKAGLYAGSYGEKGVSRTESEKAYNDTPNHAEQTVFGTRLVSVTYVLNPQNVISEDDLITVKNDSPTSYTVTSSDKKIDLKDAECSGYNFLGWYTDSDCSGDKSEKLNTTIGNDVTLYAKWEKIKVTFQILMDKNSSNSYYNDAEFEGNANWTKEENNTYVSVKTVKLSYGEKILATDGVNLMDYTTNTLGITELELQEDGYSGSNVINAETIVTKELAEFYKTKAGNDEDAVLILHVKNVQKRIAAIIFSVNKKDGKPVDAAFANGSTQISANVSVDKEIGEISGFGDKSVTDGNSIGLVKPKATGYTFIGWNTNASATKDTQDGWVTEDSVFKNNTIVYAIWQANTYRIEFNAGEGSWVTSKDEAPEVGTSEVKKLNYYWIYDTPVTGNNSFWLKDENDNEYMTEMPYAWREGYVFDHNKGWTYTYTDEEKKTVTEVVESTEALSQLAVKALNTAVGVPNGYPEQTALVITANYTPVTVTYHRNEGKWTSPNSKDEVTPAYGDGLAGYVKGEDSSQNAEESSENAEFNKVVEMIGANGSRYYVADTMSKYFADHNSTYVESDYRNVISRKGYTFYGWYETQDDADGAIADDSDSTKKTKVVSVGTAPRFQNVDLYAAWKPNSYTVQIKNKDKTKPYSYTTFGNTSGTEESAYAEVTDISVTTGQEIEVDNWPTRSSEKAWYVKNINDNDGTTKRYFLGATFAVLDPGTKTTSATPTEGEGVYKNYVKILEKLEETETLYQNKAGDLEGTVFKLPDDDSYRNSIAGTDGAETYTVPDYPNGSEITMYAVYREQSIVFVERYVDKNGDVQENIVYTSDWNEWSDYPNGYSNSIITFEGYTLVGWYVNSIVAEEDKRYPSDDKSYAEKLEGYQADAAINGTYDIMVYTVYAPKISRDVPLNAQPDSTSTKISSNTYTLPGSMQKGILSMNLSPEMPQGLQLVSRTEMESHEYDLEWENNGTKYTSDTAVAIEITVNGQGRDTMVKNLSEQTDGTLSFDNLEIGAGDQITLTLYHSRVMTVKKEYSFNLEIKFNKDGGNEDNVLENQLIVNKVTVSLTPSIYTVNYSMELPETLDKLTILKTNGTENWGDFSKPEDNSQTIKKQVKTGYGSDLLMNFPEIEGYTKNGVWKVTENINESIETYTKLTMKVSAESKGVINLSSGYTIQTYQLSADSNVQEHWKIIYSEGPDGSEEKELSVNGTAVSVKYHSAIKFEPRNLSSIDPAEFVTLTFGNDSDTSTMKLSDYAKESNNVYIFTMPAQNVAGSYITVETLYLEDGTISITENDYTQQKTDGNVNKTWRGNYQILQNAQDKAEGATSNTLILTGNLLERNILLGNLNISSDNSIELKANESNDATKATLTMNTGNEIIAKNIQVPADCELTLTGSGAENSEENTSEQISGTLNLAPDKTNAAIGGTLENNANGKITLQNLNISLSMLAGSEASGIGPANRDTESKGDISLENCNVIVEEGSTTEVYKGVWIGGNKVPEVTMNKVVLNTRDKKHMAGPVVTTGKNVNINNSKIGTADANVSDPVYAVEKLNIENSKIYINIQDNIIAQQVKVPIGTLSVDGQNGQTTIGKSVIKVIRTVQGEISDIYSGIMKIEDADSNVLIDGTQLVEISNGSINLNGTEYTQNENMHEADASRKNYLLLEEGMQPSSAPNLTVETLVENSQIEIKQPLSTNQTNVSIGDLTIQQNTKLILNGNLEVNGGASILPDSTNASDNADSSVTVTVTTGKSENDSVYGISFQSSDKVVFANAKGSNYIQDGGKLSSSTDFSDGSMNVTLNNVTATVPNLYADELVIDGGSVTAKATESMDGSKSAKGEVGSKPAENGVSVVTIKDASVTADSIGALGEYDKTFTSVNTENVTLKGKLIQDHYRLEYDGGRISASLETTSLKHTVRTETQMPVGTDSDSSVTVLPENGIPGNPTGTDSGLFGCWYINTNSGREALLSQDTAFPAGLNKRTILSGSTLENVTTNDITNNADGTKTLTVHAWLKATGTVTIKEGRVFKSFDNGGQTVTVKSNGAWTAQLVSTATSVENRDYLVNFDSALPKGTTLTLTEPATALSTGKYYWYKVASEDVSSVRFTDFTVMGGTEKFKSVTKKEEIPENETFLLSVDFANTSAMANLKQQVSFKLLSSSEVSSSEAIDMASVSCILTEAVKGNVTVSDQTVSVSIPKNAEQLNEQKLFLQAVITSKVSSDANIQATWGNKTGTWLSRDTVLFEIGEYDLIASDLYGEYSFSGLENGTYQISWSIVYGASATDNISGNIISNIATSNYIESHAEPFLKVTANTTSRVLAAGTEQTLEFSYESTTENVSVAVQKQEDLCKFTSVSEGVAGVETDTNGYEVTFKETAAPGTYRICFSLDDTSSNDNVYFTFIIK